MNSLHINDWFTILSGGFFSLLAAWWSFKLGRKAQPVVPLIKDDTATADLVKLVREMNEENHRLQQEIISLNRDAHLLDGSLTSMTTEHKRLMGVIDDLQENVRIE